MKRHKRKELPSLVGPLARQRGGYRALSKHESLYSGSLHLLKSTEFEAVLSRLVLDLSPLPLLPEADFFQLLEESEQLRLLLESCLVVLGRRCYEEVAVGDPEKETIPDRDEVWRKYRALLRVVAIVYDRISAASTRDLMEVVYDNWLIDIPKLLEFCAIYGESNPELTTRVVAQAYRNPNYDADTLDF